MSKDRVMTVQERARGLARERLTRIDALLHDHAARREVAGAVGLIAVGDAVHIATAGVQDLASAVPMRRDRIFRIASMTKPVVAAAVMLLVEEGRIALDDAIDRAARPYGFHLRPRRRDGEARHLPDPGRHERARRRAWSRADSSCARRVHAPHRQPAVDASTG